MAVQKNTATLTGTYAGNEVTQSSEWALQDTGNFMVKTGDRIYGDVGTIANYRISMTTGATVPDDLILTDSMDDGLEFVDGSLILNDEPQTGTIADLVIDYQPNTSYEIQYQALKTSKGKLKNFAYWTGTYCGDPVTITSQWVLIDTGVEIVKTGDRSFGAVGTVVNYTINITIGDILPDDLTFGDKMDEGIEFVDGTLTLDGVAQSGTIFDLVIPFEKNTSYVVEYQAIKTAEGKQ